MYDSRIHAWVWYDYAQKKKKKKKKKKKEKRNYFIQISKKLTILVEGKFEVALFISYYGNVRVATYSPRFLNITLDKYLVNNKC